MAFAALLSRGLLPNIPLPIIFVIGLILLFATVYLYAVPNVIKVRACLVSAASKHI